jgi:hypothetical protein
MALVISAPVRALTVQLDAATGNAPPEIFYPIGQSPLDLTLRLKNDAFSDTAPILLWQLGLHVHGDNAAVGMASFADIALPDDPLFGSSSMPSTGNELPATDIVVSDTDPSFNGVPIASQQAKNILKLHVAFSAQTQGVFALTMSEFDEQNPDGSSFWIPQSEDLPMIPFDNPPSQADPAVIELATIHVVSATLIGDYNRNHVVDAADYTLWRDTFGSTTDLRADGNGNGQIDAGDFGAWKMHFGEVASGGSGAVVPEPATFGSMLIAAVVAAIVARKTRRKPAERS